MNYKIARDFAIRKHEEVNQLYDGQSYEVHLQRVFDNARRFSHLISEDKLDIVFSACWLHDIIEDTRVNFNELAELFGDEVVEIVYSVTDEKGRNRKERKNAKFWHELRQNRFGQFVKLADYIANSEYSKQSGSRMFDVYKKGYQTLWEEIFSAEYREMFLYLEELFEDIRMS